MGMVRFELGLEIKKGSGYNGPVWHSIKRRNFENRSSWFEFYLATYSVTSD